MMGFFNGLESNSRDNQLDANVRGRVAGAAPPHRAW
jgi:hypothetical protein